MTQGYALPCSTRAETARDQWPAVALPTLDLWDGRSSQPPSHRVTGAGGVIFLAPPPTGRLRGKGVWSSADTRHEIAGEPSSVRWPVRPREQRSCLIIPAVDNSARLKEKPGSFFCLVDKILKYAGCGHIAISGGHFMSFSHIDGKRLVVFHQFTKHVDRRNEILLVVFDATQSCNMADRS